MDFIFIEELRVKAWVGIYAREKTGPQTVELNLTFGVPDAAAEHDDIADTIDYAVVTERIRRGVIATPSVWWQKHAGDGQNANAVTSSAKTAISRPVSRKAPSLKRSSPAAAPWPTPSAPRRASPPTIPRSAF